VPRGEVAEGESPVPAKLENLQLSLDKFRTAGVIRAHLHFASLRLPVSDSSLAECINQAVDYF